MPVPAPLPIPIPIAVPVPVPDAGLWIIKLHAILLPSLSTLLGVFPGVGAPRPSPSPRPLPPIGLPIPIPTPCLGPGAEVPEVALGLGCRRRAIGPERTPSEGVFWGVNVWRERECGAI